MENALTALWSIVNNSVDSLFSCYIDTGVSLGWIGISFIVFNLLFSAFINRAKYSVTDTFDRYNAYQGDKEFEPFFNMVKPRWRIRPKVPFPKYSHYTARYIQPKFRKGRRIR